jgi:xanthine dehydrogenase YagS FAD-binding subunit
VIVDMNGNKIRKAQIALGGVGTRPWRSPEAEQELAGREASDRVFRKAAEAALNSAKTYRNNGFKVELAKRTLVRALQTVTASA